MELITLKDKRILVTGGKGYLGSFLVEALEKEGANVFILTTKKTLKDNEYCVDISDAEKVREVFQIIQPEIVYHLAANIDRNRDFSNYNKMAKINVEGTFNILEVLKDIEYSNFIFTSSSEVYGNNESPFHEELNLMPASPYSLTKVQGEALIKTFSTVYNKNYTIMRLFNFFGKNMSEDFFIPQMIGTLKRNEDFKMTKGEQKRDFMFIDDVIQALLLAGKNKSAYRDTFNVCSGTGTFLKNIAHAVTTKIESKGTVLFGAIPYRNNEIWEMIGDNGKIKKKLGFTLITDLEQGIERCI